ncbi:MAG: hypothetical protein K0S76_163 [Herbinix sp.]|jgi:hypothetical protein|nr:hypothetical protein [Herbinix sp.]
MKKKVIATLLSLTLLFATSSPVSASEITAAGAGTTPVDLTVETQILRVTIPLSLPITMTEDGEVMVADNASITNHGAGPIKITDIEIKGANGWSTVDYNSLDNASATVGGKNVGFSLNLAATNILTTGANTDNFSSGAIVITKGQSLPLTYDAVLPAQKDEMVGVQVAEVIFTIGWND